MSSATWGRGEERSVVWTPNTGNGFNKNSVRSGIFHCVERGTIRCRVPSRPWKWTVATPLTSCRRGLDWVLGVQLVPPGVEAAGVRRGPEGMSGRVMGFLLTAPGSQDSRRAADYVARMGVQSGST